jgi:uncharacterized damage-inducible protein DinB
VIDLLHSLFRYQAWADAAILEAVQAHPKSLQDEQIFKTLHHVVTAQRVYLSRFLERPFEVSKESPLPGSFDQLVRIFRATHEEELAWIESLAEGDLERRFDMAVLGTRPTIAEGLTQVVMHGQNHRGQCLTRLRENGGKPPTLDYILWAKAQPVPSWPGSSLPSGT